MKYILAMDQGTTSARAILFDRGGQIHAHAQREFEQYFPQPGWVEHDPKQIWETQRAVAKEVGGDLAAIGIANQRETTVVWDRATGEPIYPAIVWQDRRTAARCARLKGDSLEHIFTQKTGLVCDPYFSGTKIEWILDNVPGARNGAEAGKLAFGTIDSWLVWNLTGGKVHATDVTNASRTLLFNIHTLEWDQDLLDILNIPASLLPDVRSSSEVYGHTEAGVPIAGIAGDQQAALFGQGCIHHGMAKTTYGTGCFLLMNTDGRPVLSRNHLLTTMACQVGGKTQYALEGSVFIGGAVVQWLRDKLGLIKSSSEIEALARQVEETMGVVFVPAFTGLGAPYWDSEARGAIFGMTRGTSAAHIARAAIESIAFQVTDVLRAMEADTGEKITELRADGAATSNELLMQFQADLLGVPVIRPALAEVTALGAAYLAGLAVGYWESLEDVEAHWQAKARSEPQMRRTEASQRLNLWKEAVASTRNFRRP
jgi:glycerol kinase